MAETRRRIAAATALPMGLIGCIGLASTISANVLERIRKLGAMLASRLTVRETLAYL